MTVFSRDYLEPNDSALIARVWANHDFQHLEDGYLYYWPGQIRGAISAQILRLLADELDRNNAAWDAQVKKDVGP